MKSTFTILNRPNRERGMVSHLLLFIVLIMLANAAIFAPNIASLKDTRQIYDEKSDTKILSVLASSLARASVDSNNDGIFEAPRAWKIATRPLPRCEDSESPEGNPIIDTSTGGELPREYCNILADKKVRYCPYWYGAELNQGGRVSLNAAVGEDDDSKIIFSLIFNRNATSADLTCSAARSGGTQYSEVINITNGMVSAMKRSAMTESAQLPSGCRAGEEMVFVAESTVDGVTTPASFSCVRNVAAFAAIPGANEPANCPNGSAIGARGADANGLSCANITAINTRLPNQTTECVAVPVLDANGVQMRDAGNNLMTTDRCEQISIFNVMEYFNPRLPVTSNSEVPNIPGLSTFDCVPPYFSPSKGRYISGGVVIVLQDGSLFCANSGTMQVYRRPIPNDPITRANGCPISVVARNRLDADGNPVLDNRGFAVRYDEIQRDPITNRPMYNRVLVRPDVSGGRALMCEGYSANDPNYGQFNLCTAASADIVFGFSPENQRFQCLERRFASVQYDTSFIYPERSTTPCSSGVLALSGGNNVSCGPTYRAGFNTNLRSTPGYRANWAFNWNPVSKQLTSVDPGAVKYPPNASEGGTVDDTFDGGLIEQ